MNKLFSGGAIGADQLWGEVAVKHGWEVSHIITHKTKYITPSVSYFKLSEEEFNANWPYVLKLNRTLNRGFPETYTTAVKKLLARNVAIIRRSQAIYGVGYLNSDHTEVAGGTGWGFTQAIIEHKPCYIFDQNYNEWLKYNPHLKRFIFVDLKAINHSIIAGVGSRKITEAGQQAIIKLF